MRRPLVALLIGSALWMTACERSHAVKVPTPVVVTPPPCVDGPPPIPPDVGPETDEWASYYTKLAAWAWAAWRACRGEVEL